MVSLEAEARRVADVVLSVLTKTLPAPADVQDDMSTLDIVLEILGCVPLAMDAAARNAALDGDDRRFVVTAAIGMVIDDIPESYFYFVAGLEVDMDNDGDIDQFDKDAAKAQRRRARDLIARYLPASIDVAYSVYQHRHVFKRRAARMWAKTRRLFGCCCSFCSCC
jgi:hypothetical protein